MITKDRPDSLIKTLPDLMKYLSLYFADKMKSEMKIFYHD